MLLLLFYGAGTYVAPVLSGHPPFMRWPDPEPIDEFDDFIVRIL